MDGAGAPPYQVKHFVVTHRPPPGRLDGPVEFVFVTEAWRPPSSSPGRRRAIGTSPWEAAATSLASASPPGLVDEVQLHVVPVILGVGIPLFAGLTAQLRLVKTRVVDGPMVTHLRYRVGPPDA